MQSSEHRRILIVDDSTLNLFLLQTALEAEGYVVDTATNGSLALTKIETSPPDLVLLDVMMPGINGSELTQRIRQNDSLPYIPILLITGYDEVSLEQKFDIEADDLIRKPINLEKLLERIMEFWS